MVIAKCTKCFAGYRASKAKETLCAKCEVDYQINEPLSSSSKETDEEFSQFAGEIYGEISPEQDLQLHDVFNHGSRLKVLSAKLEGVKDPKVRNRQKREIGRLKEEHDAVQAKLAGMQNRLLQAVMFPTTVSQEKSKLSKPPKSPRTPRGLKDSFSFAGKHDGNNNMNFQKGDDPDSVQGTPMEIPESPEPSHKIEDKVLLASPVKQTAAFFEMAAKRSTVDETISLSPKKSSKKASTIAQNVQTLSKPLATVSEGASFNITPCMDSKELIEVQDSGIVEAQQIADEDSEEQPQKQLGRSNSVRNRIKAFEEISRRASTGSWDRKSTPEKKALQF